MAASTFQSPLPPEIKPQDFESKVTAAGEEAKTETKETFSHFKKLSTFVGSTSLGSNDNCLFTARSVVHLLTGKPIIFQADKKHPVIQVTAPTPSGRSLLTLSTLTMVDRSFEIKECEFIEFFRKKDTGYLFDGITELLKLTPKSEHSIYHITLGKSIHAFVIEKISNETDVLFRVYQSWVKRFNLKQGIDEHPEMNGEGLMLFLSSIKDICEGSFNCWKMREPEEVDNIAKIIKYPFEPSTLDFLLDLEQKKLENYQLNQESIEKICNPVLREALSFRK